MRFSKKGEADPPAEVKTESKPAKESEFSVEKKVAEILASKMPESQKKDYIQRLTGNNPDLSGVPFIVWANVRKIRESTRAGMAVTCASVKTKTLVEWDEFFKNF